jgi:hypothetical protein
MTKTVANIGRAVLTVCAAAAVLGQVATASALSVAADDITAIKPILTLTTMSAKPPVGRHFRQNTICIELKAQTALLNPTNLQNFTKFRQIAPSNPRP